MTYDPISTYRTAQVTTSSPVGQVVLLYQGAIRFATIHLAALERRDIEAAHHASIRSQEIVSGLREVLDLSAGPVAGQLDALYAFILGRLVAGNTAKDPRPTAEAIELLRSLLGAWRELAAGGDPARAERTVAERTVAERTAAERSAPSAGFATFGNVA